MNSNNTYYGVINYIVNRRRSLHISSMPQRSNRVKYHCADLESWSDVKCKTMFRFTYAEICRICEAIKLEKELKSNDLKVNRELAMTILLYLYSFPRRLADMVCIFGLSESNIERTVNGIFPPLLKEFKYGLVFDERQLSKKNCERFSKAIYEKGAFYPHIVGFIDGTMQQICRTKNPEDQELMYNSWKHMYCNKLQAISYPDGITSSLSGPFIGKRNDRGKLNESGLLPRLAAHFKSISPHKGFAIYGDEEYWVASIPKNLQE